ncbi:MAG: MoaD/ThiS family protein [Candidatus Phosphoribacter sp.]|nr:MoaD/ThiS family protein [Actinomycetales bacterium]
MPPAHRPGAAVPPDAEVAADPVVQGGDGPVVVVRYWAAARALAGVDSESVAGSTVGEIRAAVLGRHPGLAPVLRVATLLLDGRAAHESDRVSPGSTLEVLPPFAGG